MADAAKLSRREALKLGAAALGGTMERPAAPAAQRGGAAGNRPNFVIFMTDGQRPDQFSYMAGRTSLLKWDQSPVSRLLHTPNMDRISAGS